MMNVARSQVSSLDVTIMILLAGTQSNQVSQTACLHPVDPDWETLACLIGSGNSGDIVTLFEYTDRWDLQVLRAHTTAVSSININTVLYCTCTHVTPRGQRVRVRTSPTVPYNMD